MIGLTRSYPTGLDAAGAAVLYADLQAQLVTAGWLADSALPDPLANFTQSNGAGAPIFNLRDTLAVSMDDYSDYGEPVLPITDPCHIDFASDVLAGFAWLAIVNEVSGEVSIRAWVNLKRYPADEYDGLVGRFGCFFTANTLPQFQVGGYPMLALTSCWNVSGGINGEGVFNLWSPIGNGIRHAGSPLPRMIAPLFLDTKNAQIPPLQAGELTACLPGELDCVMRATDGYALGEEAAPGWHVYGSAGIGYYALKRPATLTVF